MVTFVDNSATDRQEPAAQQEMAGQDPAKKSCACTKRKERIQSQCDTIMRNNLRSSRLGVLYYMLAILLLILLIIHAIRKTTAA